MICRQNLPNADSMIRVKVRACFRLVGRRYVSATPTIKYMCSGCGYIEERAVNSKYLKLKEGADRLPFQSISLYRPNKMEYMRNQGYSCNEKYGEIII